MSNRVEFYLKEILRLYDEIISEMIMKINFDFYGDQTSKQQ
jgi:hypothetical protein